MRLSTSRHSREIKRRRVVEREPAATAATTTSRPAVRAAKSPAVGNAMGREKKKKKKEARDTRFGENEAPIAYVNYGNRRCLPGELLH